MEAFNPPFRPSNPPLPRSSSIKSPPRVNTAPHTSKKPHLHPHRPHRHHHAKENIQTTIQPHHPSSFGDLLKQSSWSSTQSPAQSVEGSRAGSVAKVDEGDGGVESRGVMKEVRVEDVLRERERAEMRERELRASLQTLSEYSLTSTRRTDDTYYSILEKLAVLRSTIGELQELSSLTRELHEDFQNDADELEEEVNGQLDAFHNFEPQEQQVAVLEERVNAGREKARGLNRRLDDARKRVEVRERVEKEWEAKISRRLRMLWGILGTLAAICAIFFAVQQFQLPHSRGTEVTTSTSKMARDIHEAPIPLLAKEVLSSCHAPSSSSLAVPAFPSSPAPDEHPTLRLFDEL